MTDENNETSAEDAYIAKLVGQVKDKCRITWDDEATERVIGEEIIPTALSVVRFKIGIPENAEFDFSEPGLEHKIFLNYCYYAWHDAEDDFEGNYAADLAHARRVWEVRNDAQEQEATT